MTTQPDPKMFHQIVDQTVTEMKNNFNNKWQDSPFAALVGPSNDERGYWGELLIYRLLTHYFPGIPLFWDKNSNTGNEDGVYDLIFKQKKTEIKTAFEGTTTNTFQHENIYAKKVWERLLLLDIIPTGLFFSVETKDSMVEVFNNEQHPVWKKKGTLRDSQTDKWKFDHSHATLQRTLKHGSTCFVEYLNDDDVLKFLDFIKKNFID